MCLKTKRHPMKPLVFFLFIGFSFFACDDKNELCSPSTRATVKDLSALDGCGFVFELEDGSRLEPLILFTFAADPTNPLYQFEFVDGKKVKISYEQVNNASSCMAGEVVRITCIEEI